MIAVIRARTAPEPSPPPGAVPHVVVTARAAARDELVLGHPHPYRREVEYLPPLHTHLRRAR